MTIRTNKNRPEKKVHRSIRNNATNPNTSSPAQIEKLADDNDTPLKPQQVMQLQRQLGNQATMQIINRKKQEKATGQSLPFAGLKMVQRKPGDKGGLLSDDGSSGGMDFGLLDLGDDVADKEDENDANVVEDDMDDQQSIADEAQSLVSTVDTFPKMILAARQMDAVMSKYVDKKSKFDLVAELEGLEAMVIKSVGRADVKTVDDLILLLENPFKVTAKDVHTTTVGLRAARKQLIQISGKLGKVESKISKKSKKQNIKKMKDTLQPNTTIASKIGGKFTDVTSSIVGSIVGAVSSPFITPVGGAAAGYATKKGMQMGAKKGASKLRDKKLVKDQMGMDDADQFESLLGVADKKKGKVKDKWDKGKETVKYYSSKDGAKKETMKKLGKDLITGGVEFGADLLGGVDGGISSAVFSGVSSFGASEATDKMFGKTEVESSDVAFQLDMTPIEAVGKALDDFLKATDSLD